MKIFKKIHIVLKLCNHGKKKKKLATKKAVLSIHD